MAGKHYPAHAEIEFDSRGVLLSSCNARADGAGLYARRGAEAWAEGPKRVPACNAVEYSPA